jgi:hypothetical protein
MGRRCHQERYQRAIGRKCGFPILTAPISKVIENGTLLGIILNIYKVLVHESFDTMKEDFVWEYSLNRVSYINILPEDIRKEMRAYMHWNMSATMIGIKNIMQDMVDVFNSVQHAANMITHIPDRIIYEMDVRGPACGDGTPDRIISTIEHTIEDRWTYERRRDAFFKGTPDSENLVIDTDFVPEDSVEHRHWYLKKQDEEDDDASESPVLGIFRGFNK